MKHLFAVTALSLFLSSLFAQDFTTEAEINKLLEKIPTAMKADASATGLELRAALKKSELNGFYKFGQLSYWAGEILLSQASYDSAGSYFEQALPFLEKDQDEPVLGRAYIGMGYVLNFHSLFAQALDMDLKAEKIFRKMGDKKMLARSLKRIGDDIFFNDQSKAGNALSYYQESIALSEEEKDTLNIIRGLNSLSGVYSENGQHQKVATELKRAVALGKKINCLRCLAISYSQWGISEHKQGNYTEAIKLYRLEFDINKKMGADYDQFFVYQNIAEALVQLKRYDQALQYADSALRIAETEASLQHRHDSYMVAYTAYKGKGDAGNALKAFENQMQLRDSIFTEEREKIMSNLRAAYDLERKELQIEDLQNKNRISELEANSSRQRQLGLVVFLLLLLVVVGILYNRYQLKQRTTRALDEKNAELQRLNSFKDKMFAVISHDLRNPVDAFSTLMESLTQNLQHASQEELKEFLESMLHSARDLKGLLTNLLEWSLVQIGKLPFHPKPFSLAQAVQESIAHVQAMAEINNIALTATQADATVLADKNMVVIIIRNLLTNAIKFSVPGKAIYITTTLKPGAVLLAVRDEGIGMTTEEVTKLFHNNEDARSIGNSSAKGAGIGLLLCKELAEKNNGKIYAESALGTGSTFYLELPQ
ncbi:MAG: tetratricopeptide repeat protein [Cytophagales bacterium]|nr:tetratricopeptide repeat protein [Cytophagales bacterium]